MTWTLLTVTPVLRLTVAPGTKFVPVMVTWAEPARAMVAGLIPVTVGAAVTANAVPVLPRPPSPLTTETVRAPGVAAPATETVATIVAVSTRFWDRTATPVPAKDSHAPSVKLDPDTVTVAWAPPPSAFGVTSVTTGPAVTIRHPVQVTPPASPGLVTMTSRGPAVAANAVEKATLRCCSSTTVTDVTATPLAGTVTFTPLVKWSPVIVMVRWAPGPSAFGVMDATLGPAVTVKQPAQVIV